MTVLILFASFILGVQGGVVDLQMCSGTWSSVIDYTVNEIVLYNNSLQENKVASNQCHCDISTTEELDTLNIRSESGISNCYDLVRFTIGPSNVDFYCQSGTERTLSMNGSNQVRLTLSRSTVAGKDDGTIIPVKIKLNPPQNSLKISCYTGLFETSPTFHSTTSDLSTPTPDSSLQTNTTVAVPVPNSEANYTLLVIGLVGLGVAAGSCIVCAIICRQRRNAKRLSNAGLPRERFHQTVYRATSNMVKSIITKRPLPRLPMSLRRTKKGQMCALRNPVSGLYDSIKSQRAGVNGKKKPNPEVTPQLSNDSSICYINPISDNYLSPISFTPGKSTENTADTYLTTVILHENGSAGQSSGRTQCVPADDSLYVEAEPHGTETDDNYVCASTGGSRARNQEQNRVAITVTDDRTGVHESDYMSMDHCSEINKDCSFFSEDNTSREELKDQSVYITPTNGQIDNTFPEIIEFQPLHENKSSENLVKEELKPKPKRYVRAPDNTHLSS